MDITVREFAMLLILLVAFSSTHSEDQEPNDDQGANAAEHPPEKRNQTLCERGQAGDHEANATTEAGSTVGSTFPYGTTTHTENMNAACNSATSTGSFFLTFTKVLGKVWKHATIYPKTAENSVTDRLETASAITSHWINDSALRTTGVHVLHVEKETLHDLVYNWATVVSVFTGIVGCKMLISFDVWRKFANGKKI